MDGASIGAAFGSAPGPDCLKEMWAKTEGVCFFEVSLARPGFSLPLVHFSEAILQLDLFTPAGVFIGQGKRISGLLVVDILSTAGGVIGSELCQAHVIEGVGPCGVPVDQACHVDVFRVVIHIIKHVFGLLEACPLVLRICADKHDRSAEGLEGERQHPVHGLLGAEFAVVHEDGAEATHLGLDVFAGALPRHLSEKVARGFFALEHVGSDVHDAGVRVQDVLQVHVGPPHTHDVSDVGVDPRV